MARQWQGVFSINRAWQGVIGIFVPPGTVVYKLDFSDAINSQYVALF